MAAVTRKMSISNIVSTYIRPIREWYSEINSATLTGAIDVIVVEQEDGTYVSSPFHVRFGKLGVLKAKEKIVDIEVNNEPVDIHMKLDDNGAAFFVEPCLSDDENEEIPPELATSPLPELQLSKRPSYPSDSDNNKLANVSRSLAKDFEEESSGAAVGGGSSSTSSSKSSSRDVSRSGAKLNNNKGTTTKDVGDHQVSESTDTSVAVQTDKTTGAQSGSAAASATPLENNNNSKSKQNRKKRKRRSVAKQHTRGGSKSSLKEIIANDEDEQADEEPGSSDSNIFDMDDVGAAAANKASSPVADDAGSATPTTPVKLASLLGAAEGDDEEKPMEVDVDNREEDDKTPTPSCGKMTGGFVSAAAPGSASATPIGVTAPTTPSNAEGSFLASRLPNPESFDRVLESMDQLQKEEAAAAAAAANDETAGKENLQYFSEPDMSPITSPVGSRPPSPIMSDTEYESRRREDQKNREQNWEWGKLPSTPQTPAAGGDKRKPEDKKGDSNAAKQETKDEAGGILSYLWGKKKTEAKPAKKEDDKDPHQGQPGGKDSIPGVYLDDLKGDDEEMMQIYVGSHLHNSSVLVGGGHNRHSHPVAVPDDDAESGNGPSLPMSPHSVEGAIGGSVSRYESDFEHRRSRLPKDVDVSLCGGLESPAGFSAVLFEQSKVSYDDFVDRLRSKRHGNPDYDFFKDPSLVVRIGEQYYTWSAACPILMSSVLYGRTLPSDMVEVIAGSYQEAKHASSSAPAEASAMGPTSGGLEAPSSAPEPHRKSSSWWPFGSRKEGSGNESSGERESPAKDSAPPPPPSTGVTPDKSGPEPKIDSVLHDAAAADPIAIGTTASAEAQTGSSLPGTPVNTPVRIHTSSEGSDDPSTCRIRTSSTGEKYRKTLRLSSDAISRLNLRSGPNEIQFSVTTAYQGTSRCSCHVYLWKWTDKIVISDIDGTITKSDVLGHVLPIIGRDWAQSGVASLFTKIRNNGYHIAYLSARAIGQAAVTKDYLNSVSQGDMNLPDGPLLLNPTSLVNAFHREVIIKKPEEFKIACLRDIQKLFPAESNCFYAGYGNRLNDVWAYRAVGIPISRIFTINPKGELRHELTQTFQTSTYYDQSQEVNRLYPRAAMRRALAASLANCRAIAGDDDPSSHPYSGSPRFENRRPSDFDDTWTRPYKRGIERLRRMSENEREGSRGSDSPTTPAVDPDVMFRLSDQEDDDDDEGADEEFDTGVPGSSAAVSDDEASLYADALSRKESVVLQPEHDS